MCRRQQLSRSAICSAEQRHLRLLLRCIARPLGKFLIRKLSTFDYLTGIDDFFRHGSFCFKEDKGGVFINYEKILIDQLIQKKYVERGEKDGIWRVFVTRQRKVQRAVSRLSINTHHVAWSTSCEFIQ